MRDTSRTTNRELEVRVAFAHPARAIWIRGGYLYTEIHLVCTPRAVFTRFALSGPSRCAVHVGRVRSKAPSRLLQPLDGAIGDGAERGVAESESSNLNHRAELYTDLGPVVLQLSDFNMVNFGG